MKKRKFGIIIVALILIVVGFGLFVGGMVAAGGLEATKAALFHHEDILGKEFHFDISEDGVDFDIDFDRDGLDFDLDIEDEGVDLEFTI